MRLDLKIPRSPDPKISRSQRLPASDLIAPQAVSYNVIDAFTRYLLAVPHPGKKPLIPLSSMTLTGSESISVSSSSRFSSTAMVYAAASLSG